MKELGVSYSNPQRVLVLPFGEVLVLPLVRREWRNGVQ